MTSPEGFGAAKAKLIRGMRGCYGPYLHWAEYHEALIERGMLITPMLLSRHGGVRPGRVRSGWVWLGEARRGM